MTKSETKVLNDISLNRNEAITVKLPCGSHVNIYTHDSSSYVYINHSAEGALKNVEVESVGTSFYKGHTFTTCDSAWGTREEKSLVKVSHTAIYRNKEVA